MTIKTIKKIFSKKGLKIIKKIIKHCFSKEKIKRMIFYYLVEEKSFSKIWLKNNGQPVSLPPIKNTFKYIVSVQGFGHSGSGAVIDLLREIPKATVLGGVDLTGSKSNKEEACGEFDIIRVSGGLLEIEKLIDSENIFINDALINRFISLLDSSYYLQNDKIQTFVLNFMTKIIDFSIDLSHECYNLHIRSYKEHPAIYFLKHISKEEYISYCSELLRGIFSVLGNNHLLVLDQLFSDNETNLERNKQYVSNLKTILVQRDPRDVFICGLNLKEEWIPCDVTKFVRWYNILLKNYPCSDPDVLNLKFEDLVMNYDYERKKILNFLELEIDDHINVKTKFDPEISIENIGLWKNRKDCADQITYIEKHLAKWCYNI